MELILRENRHFIFLTEIARRLTEITYYCFQMKTNTSIKLRPSVMWIEKQGGKKTHVSKSSLLRK